MNNNYEEKNNNDYEKQIKSKQRVKDHGEVFTNPREVKAMLDLVKEESYKVDSRFLEPACGNGNFLVEILERKLTTVNKENFDNLVNWEMQTFMAVASIYAIDIQEDNCQESRQRMYDIIEESYSNVNNNLNTQFLESIKFILNNNIVHGDGLTGLQVGKNGSLPIIFSEWTINDNEIIRRDFAMNDMIAHEQQKNLDKKIKSDGLFGMINNSEEKKELNPSYEFKYDNIYEIVN